MMGRDSLQQAMLGNCMGGLDLHQQQQTNTISGLSGHSLASQFQRVKDEIVGLNVELENVHVCMKRLEEHQGELLLYIQYLNPTGEPRPTLPYTFTEWRKLQLVTRAIVEAGVSPAAADA